MKAHTKNCLAYAGSLHEDGFGLGYGWMDIGHTHGTGYEYGPKSILVTLWQGQGLSGWCVVVGSCGDILLAVILHWTHITYRRTPAVVYFAMCGIEQALPYRTTQPSSQCMMLHYISAMQYNS